MSSKTLGRAQSLHIRTRGSEEQFLRSPLTVFDGEELRGAILVAS